MEQESDIYASSSSSSSQFSKESKTTFSRTSPKPIEKNTIKRPHKDDSTPETPQPKRQRLINKEDFVDWETNRLILQHCRKIKKATKPERYPVHPFDLLDQWIEEDEQKDQENQCNSESDDSKDSLNTTASSISALRIGEDEYDDNLPLRLTERFCEFEKIYNKIDGQFGGKLQKAYLGFETRTWKEEVIKAALNKLAPIPGDRIPETSRPENAEGEEYEADGDASEESEWEKFDAIPCPIPTREAPTPRTRLPATPVLETADSERSGTNSDESESDWEFMPVT